MTWSIVALLKALITSYCFISKSNRAAIVIRALNGLHAGVAARTYRLSLGRIGCAFGFCVSGVSCDTVISGRGSGNSSHRTGALSISLRSPKALCVTTSLIMYVTHHSSVSCRYDPLNCVYSIFQDAHPSLFVITCNYPHKTARCDCPQCDPKDPLYPIEALDCDGASI